MRRSLLLLAALTAVASGIAAGAAAPAGSQSAHGGPGGGYFLYGRNYFAVACAFSHTNHDDPIVFPGRAGLSHQHTFFGNRTTNASSTPASLRASGQTSCSLRADTAAYWVPTLFVGSEAVQPRGAIVYYVRRTQGRVQPFPAGLQMIAGDASARSAQNLRVTSWNCGRRGTDSSSVPTCPEGRRSSLRLVVNYPNCWNGTSLDSLNHKSHMAYSADGVCPASHPVAVPALTLEVRYQVTGGFTTVLSSGGQFSGHADFVNGWNQDVLTRLVDRYLNRERRGR
jgi:hypothetical protein